MTVINSTYQLNDLKTSAEDVSLYENDLSSISSKLDKSYSIENASNSFSVNNRSINKNKVKTSASVDVTDEVKSSKNATNKTISIISKPIISNVVNRAIPKQAIGETTSNQINEIYKFNSNVNNKWSNDDDIDNGDGGNDFDVNDYDGNNIMGSENLLIQLNEKQNRMTTAAPMISPITTTTSTSSQTNANFDFNSDYYSKDDISMYDDVNNNRLNLRNTNGHFNAYEQRNIYLANDLNEATSSAGADKTRSYIHIEVFKGSLDALTSKPNDNKSENDAKHIAKVTTTPISTSTTVTTSKSDVPSADNVNES